MPGDGARTAGARRLVLARPGGAVGGAGQPGDGRDEPAAGLAGRARRAQARRQRGRRGHRDGRGAQRHRAEHDRHRRRRLHDGLLREDEEDRGAERQRPRAARADPRSPRLAQPHPDADLRHGDHHRARRVRRLGHAAREARDDEAGGSAGAGDRPGRQRVSGDGEDRRRLDSRSREAEAQPGGRSHLSRGRRGAEAGRDLRAEEPGAHAAHAGQGWTRRVLSRRDRQGDRGLLPEERRLSRDGGLRGAQVQLGRADLDGLPRPHAVRVPAEQSGPDRAAAAEHPRRHRSEVDAGRAGSLSTTR